MRLYVSVLCAFLIGVEGAPSPSNKLPENIPAVNTVSGLVVGSVARDGEYYEYLGIPYADSTSGSHRFKAPSPPPVFTEPFIASRRDIKCVAALGVGYEGTEDCLVANVFTPTLDNTRELPVMVWIKGREFDNVHGQDFSFKQFVEKDVIVVTLNYRESILGFLCLGTENAPGNAGLKDVIAGLKWVKENIGEFGGNPNDVTLFGHGSGGAVVDLVTLSPMAEGLVSKVITQSGNSIAPWAVSRDNLHYAVQVAEALGHVVTDVESLSSIFTRASVSALMAAINELDLKDNALAFSPCLEREDLGDEIPFMTKSPFEIIHNGEFMQVPFITGFVDNEGTIRAEEIIESDWLQKMEKNFIDFLQSDLKFESEEERVKVANDIQTYYFEEGNVNIDDYISYHGDTMILVSAIREARLRAATSTSPVYLYQFSYKGTLGEPFEGPVPVERAAHGEELAYMFPDLHVTQAPQMDLVVGDILVERWTNFAKEGLPTSDTSQVLWLPFTNENPHYLRILNTDEINEAGGSLEVDLINPHPDRITFWDSIYEEHFLDAESKWELVINDAEENQVSKSNVVRVVETDAGSEETGFWNEVYKEHFLKLKRLLTRNEEQTEEEGSGEENGGEEEGGNGDDNGGNGNGDDNGGNGNGDDNGGNGNGDDNGGNGNGDGGNGDDDDNDDNGAASTAAYTFTILCLFGILDKIHAAVTLF